MVDRRALRKRWRRPRIESQRLVEISEGAVVIASGPIAGGSIDIRRNPIALGLLISARDKLRATYDPRVEVCAAASLPEIALGQSVSAIRNAPQNQNLDTYEAGKQAQFHQGTIKRRVHHLATPKIS